MLKHLHNRDYIFAILVALVGSAFVGPTIHLLCLLK